MKSHSIPLVFILLLCIINIMLLWFLIAPQSRNKFLGHIPTPDDFSPEQNEAFSPLGNKIPVGLKTLTMTFLPFADPKIWKNPEDYSRLASQKEIFQYNPNGLLLKRSTYALDGKLRAEWIFKYDDKGHRISDEIDGILYATYRYGINGDRTDWFYYSATGTLVSQASLKYDKKNRLSEEIRKNKFGRIAEVYKYYYNEKRLISQCVRYNPPQKPFSRDIYIYDEKGNKVEWLELAEQYGVERRTAYRYNERGYLDEEIKYYQDGKIATRTKYDYDKDGNKAEETSFYGGKPNEYFKLICHYDKGLLSEVISSSSLGKEEHKSGESRSTFEYEFYFK